MKTADRIISIASKPYNLVVIGASAILSLLLSIHFTLELDQFLNYYKSNKGVFIVIFFIGSFILLVMSYLLIRTVIALAIELIKNPPTFTKKKDFNELKSTEFKQDETFNTDSLMTSYPKLSEYIESELSPLSTLIDINLLESNITELTTKSQNHQNIKSIEREDKSVLTVIPNREESLNASDLLHLGWNIWYLTNKEVKQINIASFLKSMFPKSLSNWEEFTIKQRMKACDQSTFIELIDSK